MAGKVEVKVPNYADMIARAMNNTIQEVGFKIEEIAKTNAPVDSGNYRNNIKFDNAKSVTAHADYSGAIEYGIKNPVLIKPKTAKALHFTVNGKEVFAKYAMQKTRKPNPVMRNAGRSAQKLVKEIFRRNFANV